MTYLLGNSSIDVRNDNLVIPVPQVDGTLAAARALVLSGDAEDDVIGALSELQTGLANTKQPRGQVYRSRQRSSQPLLRAKLFLQSGLRTGGATSCRSVCWCGPLPAGAQEWTLG